MKNFLKGIKISKKTIAISSVLLVLIAIPITYFFTRDDGDVKSWYSSSWLYRRSITVSGSGSTLTDEDVLVQVDTASLISAGKMRTDCGDLRLVDSDDTTLLNYWIEGGCNTTTTQVWVRIPSLPSTGKTIYIYYGNESVTSAALVWSGNVIMLADAACPAGWTRNSDLDGKFLFGSSSYGTTGGSNTHAHSNVNIASSSISTTNVPANSSGSQTGTTTTHTHTGLQIAVSSSTAIPEYLDMILCNSQSFSFNTGLISMFDSSLPIEWTRFSALDSKIPRGASTYGGSGGSISHSHSFTTGYTTSSPSGTQTSLVSISGSGGTTTRSGDYLIHTFTSSGSFSISSSITAEALVVAGGGGGGNDSYNSEGGGGAGGVLYSSSLSIGSGTTTITIGAGGGVNANGQNSSIGSLLVAIGGGHGGVRAGQTLYATSGGSGGGGSACCAAETNPGSGTAGQGNSGGTGNGASAGGGGGKGAVGGVPNGGTGASYSISGSSICYGGGGGGYPNGSASCGGGAFGSAGTANRGGGGGGGAAGGSGIAIIRYYSPLSSGSFASGNHTHTSNSASIANADNTPPYIQMIFAKANTNAYVTNHNILITSSLPPLGWNRFTPLDNRFPRGSLSYGTTGGASTHTHGVSISTGGPSTTLTAYGSGTNFANTTHTHTGSSTTTSISNLPAYMTVIYSQRKTSLTASINTEEMYNQAPTASTSLQTNNTTNPVGVVGTPVFNAVFQDPNSGNTAIYYQIQVNTSSAFNGTTMWDSGKTTLSPALAIGSRMPNKTYAGTALSNGTTYYWRIKFWDNSDAEGAWSSTAQFTMNTPPTAPTSLQTESATNPTGITDTTPEFSAIFNDPNTGDTGTYYEIQVNTLSDFTGTVMWNSGQTSMTATAIGSRSPQISYAGTALTLNGAIYYWRVRFTDNYGTVGDWSETANFKMDNTPSQPTNLLIEGDTNPNNVTDTTPEFSAIFNDPDTGDSAIYYQIQVNTNDTFTGTMMWDTGKTSITGIPSGTRSPDISYTGDPLTTNTVQYKWRIKFWDNSNQESPWSSVSSFRMAGPPIAPNTPQIDGLSSPAVIHRSNPTFSAIYIDPNTDNGIYYEIEVNTLSNFSGNIMWDTDKVSIAPILSNTRSPEIQYAGYSFTPHATYYWRIRFWDELNQVSEWSSTSSFTTEISGSTNLNNIGLEGININ